MSCQLCEKFREDYPLEGDLHVLERNEDGSPGICSSPLECAFDLDSFSPDNWGCKTMLAIRESVESFWHNESNIAVIPIPVCEIDDIQQGFLVMTWYKTRGRVGQAWVIGDENHEPLNLKTAQYILSQFGESI